MKSQAALRHPRGLLIPATLAVLFVVAPLGGLLSKVRWSSLTADVVAPDVLTALRLSLECSAIAVCIALVLGAPLAFILARSRVPGRRLIRGLVMVPLVLPPVVGGVALQSAFGRSTFAGDVLRTAFGISLPFSTLGAALAEAFVAFPFLVITAEAGLRQRDEQYEEVAATLGAGTWRRFWWITLPLLLPSLLAGAALCWARALGEFGATITFAGSFPQTTETLPLAAYTSFEGAGDTGRAVTLSFILLLISVLVLLALRSPFRASR